jgi:hypothetical protein
MWCWPKKGIGLTYERFVAASVTTEEDWHRISLVAERTLSDNHEYCIMCSSQNHNSAGHRYPEICDSQMFDCVPASGYRDYPTARYHARAREIEGEGLVFAI